MLIKRYETRVKKHFTINLIIVLRKINKTIRMWNKRKRKRVRVREK